MKPKVEDRLHPAIDSKLAVLARSSPTPPWLDSWSRLGTQSTNEGRLRVCQAIRDAGSLPGDIGYSLVAWAAEILADDDDAWRGDPLGSLNTFECVRAFERDFVVVLEKYGEAGMADLVRSDIGEHDRRREVGRLFFFGPDEDEEEVADPDWLDHLLRKVAAHLVSGKPVESLAYRVGPGQDVRVLHVCPPAGLGWAIDIERIRESFDEVSGCGWYAAPAEEGEVPYLWVAGEFDGHEVFLRVLPTVEAGQKYETWRRPT